MIDFFVSSGACPSNDLRDVLSWAAHHDFNVELSPEMNPLSFEDARQVLLPTMMSTKISLHHYFPGPPEPFVMNLGHPSTCGRSVEHAKNIIDLCEVLKVPWYSVHAGYGIAPRTDQLGEDQSALERIPLEAATELFIDGLGQLLNHGKDRRVAVIMENNVVAAVNASGGVNDTYLFGDIESTRPILDHFGPEDLGILLDVAHLKVSSNVLGFDVLEMLDLIQDYVVALHVSENDGMADTNSKIDEDFWFKKHVHLLKNLRYVSLEVYLLEDDELRQQVELLTSLFT